MGPKHHAETFSQTFKLVGIIIAILVLLIIVILIGLGFWRTHQIEKQANNQRFRQGQIPSELPNGFLRGNRFSGRGAAWEGKIFDRNARSGINKFKDGERYKFTVYPAKGLRDTDKQVLRIDYNQPGNPWWLKFIVDEITEVEKGKYVGKVHLKVLPWPIFTATYFELSEQSN